MGFIKWITSLFTKETSNSPPMPINGFTLDDLDDSLITWIQAQTGAGGGSGYGAKSGVYNQNTDIFNEFFGSVLSIDDISSDITFTLRATNGGANETSIIPATFSLAIRNRSGNNLILNPTTIDVNQPDVDTITLEGGGEGFIFGRSDGTLKLEGDWVFTTDQQQTDIGKVQIDLNRYGSLASSDWNDATTNDANVPQQGMVLTANATNIEGNPTGISVEITTSFERGREWLNVPGDGQIATRQVLAANYFVSDNLDTPTSSMEGQITLGNIPPGSYDLFVGGYSESNQSITEISVGGTAKNYNPQNDPNAFVSFDLDFTQVSNVAITVRAQAGQGLGFISWIVLEPVDGGITP